MILFFEQARGFIEMISVSGYCKLNIRNPGGGHGYQE